MEILQEIGHKIGFDWRLAITHFVNLLIIFVLLVKFALPKLKKTIDERNQKISDGLKMREDAEKIVELANEQSSNIKTLANTKYQEVIDKGTQDAKKLTEEASQEAREIMQKANLEKEAAKSKGLSEAENIISADINKILTQISEKAFAGKVTAETNSDFVASVFKENYGK